MCADQIQSAGIGGFLMYIKKIWEVDKINIIPMD